MSGSTPDSTVAEVLLGATEDLPEGVVVIDRGSRYRYVNPAAAQMLGASSEVLVGRSLDEVYPGATDTAFARACSQVMDTGLTEVVDEFYDRIDRWFRSRVLPCGLGVIVFFTDVTEERHRTRQLQDLQVLEQLVNYADAVIVVHDLQGRFLYANEACALWAGWGARDMVGRTSEEVFGAEVSGRSRERALAVQITGRPMHLQESYTLQDGTTTTFLSVRFPLFDRDGVLTATGAVLTDISGWQLTRRDIALGEQRLRDVFTHTTLGHVVADPTKNHVLEANEAAARMLGGTVEQLVRGRLPRVVDPEAWWSLARRARARGEHGFEIEAQVYRRDGSLLPVLATVTALGDSGLASFILRDLSPLQGLQRRLVDAERLEAVGAVAGGVAHDVNNVLAAVAGYAELLELEVPENGAAQRHIAGIHRSVERASDFVDRLLAFARRQELEPADLDLASTAADLADMCQRLLPADVGLELRGSPSGVPVRADGSQVQQVLLNLVLNARDALRERGGTVTVEVDDVELDRESAAHLPPGRYARARVGDDGPGMAPEVARRCLEPFFTTRRRSGGHGLGLSTAFGIARQSGGDLRLSTVEGSGTTFTLLLPLTPVGEQTEGERVETAPTGPAAGMAWDASTPRPQGELLRPRGPGPGEGEGPVVLVVDDDEGIREVVGQILRDEGHVVLLASGGREALRQAVTLEDRVGLLLTDLDMPEGDGPTLVRLIRQLLDPSLPVVVMSALPPSPPLPGAVFLAKPFARDVLLRTVAGQLGRGGPT